MFNGGWDERRAGSTSVSVTACKICATIGSITDLLNANIELHCDNKERSGFTTGSRTGQIRKMLEVNQRFSP